jgi:hypothetical protein
VPSSISSSDILCPRGPWLRTWLASLLLTGALLLSYELFFRAGGHRPNIINDMGLWSRHRSLVYADGQRTTVVALGASRMQVGLSPRVFEKRYPRYRVVQLAIVGSSPVPVLRDLANDERFAGIIICSLSGHALDPSTFESSALYVEYYHNDYGPNDELNSVLSILLRDKFAFMQPSLRLDRLFYDLIRGNGLPAPDHVVTHKDRSRSVDYVNHPDVVADRRHRIERVRSIYSAYKVPSPEGWLKRAAELKPLVARIHDRGGKVVFVRYPTTGEHWFLDEKNYPKTGYWDNLSEKTGAATLHFMDVPGLRSFECPDTSHLDYRDVPGFTLALAQELVKLGIIEN